MEALIVLTLSFGLLWVLFLLPQQRRVRAHQQLVATLEEGDEVVLSAGIFGRITRLGPEDLDLEVAPGVELRVARQAVLRRVEHAVGVADEPDETYVSGAADKPATADTADTADVAASADTGVTADTADTANTAETAGTADPTDTDERGRLADATRTVDTA
jgi:preprotein translocase subunit YajC